MVIMDRKLKLKVCSSLYFARTMWPFHCICTTMPRPEFLHWNYPNMPCKTSSNMTGFFTVGLQVFNDGWKRSDSVDFTFQPVWCWEFAMTHYHDSRSHVFSGRLVEPKKSPEFSFFSSLFFWVLSKRCHRISQQFSNAFEETHEPLLLRWFSLWCIQSSIRSDHTTWWSRLF